MTPSKTWPWYDYVMINNTKSNEDLSSSCSYGVSTSTCDEISALASWSGFTSIRLIRVIRFTTTGSYVNAKMQSQVIHRVAKTPVTWTTFYRGMIIVIASPIPSNGQYSIQVLIFSSFVDCTTAAHIRAFWIYTK